MAARSGTTNGFRRGRAILPPQVRRIAASRGIDLARLLSNWRELVGAEIAEICRPVGVDGGRGGLGATLTILSSGARAPELDMQREAIRERINAACGRAAIGRVRITQSDAAGVLGAQPPEAEPKPVPAPDRAAARMAAQMVPQSGDAELRACLEELALNVISRSRRNRTKGNEQP